MRLLLAVVDDEDVVGRCYGSLFVGCWCLLMLFCAHCCRYVLFVRGGGGDGVVVGCCLLFVVYCLLSVVWCVLVVICCVLLVVSWLLLLVLLITLLCVVVGFVLLFVHLLLCFFLC